jgi:hypothetical protein
MALRATMAGASLREASYQGSVPLRQVERVPAGNIEIRRSHLSRYLGPSQSIKLFLGAPRKKEHLD